MTRSRLQSDSPREPDALTLADDRLAAVGNLWKRSARTIVARFGGSSMLPSIESQQELTIQCGIEPKIGDVVLVAGGGDPIVHRLVWRSNNGQWVLTRGDARAVPDLPLDSSDIVGVVDAPPCNTRRSQRWSLALVSFAARFGRTSAATSVRLLQSVSWVRNQPRVKI